MSLTSFSRVDITEALRLHQSSLIPILWCLRHNPRLGFSVLCVKKVGGSMEPKFEIWNRASAKQALCLISCSNCTCMRHWPGVTLGWLILFLYRTIKSILFLPWTFLNIFCQYFWDWICVIWKVHLWLCPHLIPGQFLLTHCSLHIPGLHHSLWWTPRF